MIFDKGARAIQWRRDYLKKIVLEKFYINVEGGKNFDLTFISYTKKVTQNEYKLNVNHKTEKHLRKK